MVSVSPMHGGVREPQMLEFHLEAMISDAQGHVTNPARTVPLSRTS